MDFSYLKKIKWQDINSFSIHTREILSCLANDKKLIEKLIDRVYKNKELIEKSESNPTLTKIVLFAQSDIEIRLHFFKYFISENPHNHRWSFSSFILNGGYEHRLFFVNAPLNENLKYKDIIPVYSKFEDKGSIYSIDHTIVHATINPMPDTVTLIIRGPVMKEKWFHLDPIKNKIQFMERQNGKRVQYDQPSLKYKDLDEIKKKLITLNLI